MMSHLNSSSFVFFHRGWLWTVWRCRYPKCSRPDRHMWLCHVLRVWRACEFWTLTAPVSMPTQMSSDSTTSLNWHGKWCRHLSRIVGKLLLEQFGIFSLIRANTCSKEWDDSKEGDLSITAVSFVKILQNKTKTNVYWRKDFLRLKP